MDPPWLERGGGKVKRGADRHYPLMPWPDIVRTVYQSGAWYPAPDSHLYMWTTANHLPDALKTMEALGFRYVTQFAWVKWRNERLQIGLGQYFRGSHELCLLGTRGRGAQVRTPARNLPSVLLAARVKHSAKPSTARALIEARSQGPYLEIFARGEAAPGWTLWGNECSNAPT